jgi:S1-C subfamily serine protease
VSRKLRPARAVVALLGLVALVAACNMPVRFASPADTRQGTASPTPSAGAASAAPSGSPGSIQTAPPNGSGALASLQENIRQVVDAVTPSVVQIEDSTGLGSGVVLDSQGDIVTNSHVVGNSTSFTVTTSDGHAYPATLVGNDPGNDLAEIRVNVGDGSPLKPATFGDSSQVRVGDIVLAIGSPLGLAESVSEGIVSGLGRQQQESASVTLTNLIQTTAPLNPGNSGGALVDISGHVVGIPTLSVGSGRGGSASNIGFAIPASQVQNVTKQIGGGGQVTHTNQPYIGVTASNGVSGGARIVSVVSGGPADKAGVQAEWVMTSLGGHAIGSSSGLTQVLASYKPGDKVDAVFQLPDGSSKTVNITVGERP